MAPFTFRMEYEILDDSLRVSQVIERAKLLFSEDSADKGIRLVGEVTASIGVGKVVCEAAAEVVPGRRPRLVDVHGQRIAELNAARVPNRKIAEELGC